MNNLLSRLNAMGDQPSRLILGLMSGTSLDGLDVALCQIQGSGFDTQVNLLSFETCPYTADFRDDIKNVFSKKQVDLEKLTLLNALIADVHAQLILNCLDKWNVDPKTVDCIASHGQTIYHAPKRLHGLDSYPNATLQIGDGDHIAVKTGIITLSDFRQKHIAAGGEGAPLALYGDCILFSSDKVNRVLLNIGGISNFTYLPANRTTSQVLCTDTGPGNTLIDALSKKYFNMPFDEKGHLARQGRTDAALLEKLLSHPFFQEDFPKTTGPELFNLNYFETALEESEVKNLTPYDLIATATEFTARGIADALNNALAENDFNVYVSGGGCHNKYLLERLELLLPGKSVKLSETLGIDPDAKEAILFALLANETLCGSAIETGAGPAVMMGKISLP